mmetsp:Transcript_33148/g.98658  ORF Transcript_33148/g.98658 Transcript_33148/m.98658 type:complete len:218 (+) Transcript_33148:214-867(+)
MCARLWCASDFCILLPWLVCRALLCLPRPPLKDSVADNRVDAHVAAHERASVKPAVLLQQHEHVVNCGLDAAHLARRQVAHIDGVALGQKEVKRLGKLPDVRHPCSRDRGVCVQRRLHQLQCHRNHRRLARVQSLLQRRYAVSCNVAQLPGRLGDKVVAAHDGQEAVRLLVFTNALQEDGQPLANLYVGGPVAPVRDFAFGVASAPRDLICVVAPPQ